VLFSASSSFADNYIGLMKKELLFVCLGNICRSPAAEAIARFYAPRFSAIGKIDSAGMGDWHVGDPPDLRAQKVGASRGYSLENLRARQLSPADFHNFDLIIAMDRDNYRAINEQKPQQCRAEVVEMAQWLRDADFVPDPYYADEATFHHVFDLLEEGVEALFQHLQGEEKGSSI